MRLSDVCDTLHRMITLVFPSGDRFSGATASQALSRLAKTQWTDEARANVKRALAWRLFVQTGGESIAINEFMDDDEFVQALADEGFLSIEREEGK